MKEIKAIIQPFMADHVISALRALPGVPGVTVSEVKGFGRGRALGDTEADENAIFGVKRIKIEIVVPDELVEQVLGVITERAHTGKPGDGKIFIHTVDEVVRIRTRERGQTAL